VTIRLEADGVPTGDILILNSGNNFSGSFNDLDKYNNIDGALIVYTITEDPITNYSTAFAGSVAEGFIVTNTNDETVDISVDKVWIGPAAGEVTIRLVADGVPTGATLLLNEGNGFSGSFYDLDKYNNVDGALIVYTITEDVVTDYSTQITGSAAEGFVVTNTNDETIDIPVDKVWIGPAAGEVTIRLVADGIPTGRRCCSTKPTATADRLRTLISITILMELLSITLLPKTQ